MKLKAEKDLSTCSNQIIIGSTGNIPGSISEDLNEKFLKFLDTEEDIKVLSDIEGSTFLIREKESEDLRMFGAKVRSLLDKKIESIAIHGSESSSFHCIEGFLLASYQFLKYFEDKEKRKFRLEFILVDESFNKEKRNELNSILKAVTWARDMVNEPVSYLTAEKFAEEIKALSASANNLNIRVLEKTQIESLKMGGLLAVNKGSIDPPTFTILEYKPAKAINKKPIVLVGKGVVYDTGGLSLKPTPNSMDVMKSDMGGAACMVGAIYLASLQDLPVHIIGLIPATDNRPGLNAYAPGDVVKMMNGKTVEVLNTDAEGRMILADALTYSKKFDPLFVIEASTLTGSAHRAIGEQASIVMGNADDSYFEQLEIAGENVHERVVRFPFWDEYAEQLKSQIADIKNIGGPSAGMITAGKFLENFVESPFIHMDIAGPAWLDKQSGYRAKGGSGYGVRLLYQFLKKYK